jgi:hypothetical protein
MANHADIKTIIDTAINIVKNPGGFYRQMPKTGGYVAPLIFVIVMAMSFGVVMLLYSLLGLGLLGGLMVGIGAIFMVTLSAMLGSFIGAAVMFVIWKLMGSDLSYETSYRCVAYATVTYPISAILGPIPFVGSLVGILIGFYLMIVASTEVHHLEKRTAYIVFGILGALMIISNIGSQLASRRMASDVEQFSQQFQGIGKQLENVDEMTPEEAGRTIGEFLKGLEQATKDQ